MSIEGGSIAIASPSISMGIGHISPIINEGPAPSFSLENTMPYTLYTLFSNPEVDEVDNLSTIKVPDVFQVGLADVNLDPAVQPVKETFASELPLGDELSFQPVVLPQVEPTAPAIQPVVKPEIKPANAAAALFTTQPQTEASIATYVSLAVDTLASEEVLVEQGVEAGNEEAKIQDEQDSKVREIRLKRVVDEGAISQRILEIVQAAKQAEEDVAYKGQAVKGQDLVGYLPAQHTKNRSGELNIVDPEDKLLDGTLIRMVRKIAALKFTSILDVSRKAPEIVAEDIPVTQGEGQLVTDQDVFKVYEPNKGRVPPALQVLRRVVKLVRRAEMVKIEKIDEGIIQDYPQLAQALGADEL